MALSNLFGWAQKNGEAAASACGSACGKSKQLYYMFSKTNKKTK